ncbi:MAG: hypothetical protein H6Q59_3407 [Firmicutes bacterium]|nr:hypothetical protein [Bacillota bacterium]
MLQRVRYFNLTGPMVHKMYYRSFRYTSIIYDFLFIKPIVHIKFIQIASTKKETMFHFMVYLLVNIFKLINLNPFAETEQMV